MKKLLAIAALSGCFLLMGATGGCDYQPSSDEIQNRHQEQINKQAVQAVGMPAIHDFQEKRILKNIYELRDQQLPTFTYTQDMNGHLHKLCDSIGYGIPYATQYTSPQYDTYYQTASTVHMSMPQADPNGLYSPASADGTWVLCLNPENKKLVPLYVEPHVIVSPFALHAAD